MYADLKKGFTSQNMSSGTFTVCFLLVHLSYNIKQFRKKNVNILVGSQVKATIFTRRQTRMHFTGYFLLLTFTALTSTV